MRLVSSIALLAAVGCSQPPGKSVDPIEQPHVRPPAGPPLESVGLSSSAMNPKVDPCTDFYEFACGGWLETAKIPGDRSGWSRGFHEILARNETDLKEILEQSQGSSDPVRAAVGSYYKACMDEAAVEKAGLSAIQPLLDEAARVKNRRQISRVIADLHRVGIRPVFDIDVDQDFKTPEVMIANFVQGGLGLPDRDYYVKDDEQSKALRAAYVDHVKRMFVLAGLSEKDAAAAVDDVMAIETALARASKTRVEMRDPEKIYNKVDARGLARLVPGFDWKTYYKIVGRPDLRDISITGEAFFKKFNALLREQPARAWGHYLQWHILAATSSTLPEVFVDESFKMQQAFTGQKEQKPRWKRCVAATDSAMPDYLGQAYVAKRFSAKAKENMETIVGAISDAFAANAADNDWMDDATRQKALEKRAKMAYLIGYPDTWKSYKFAVDPANYAKNVLAADAEHASRELAKVGKPVDRSEWAMSAPTVNAYYHPLRNHMVFPAGILQPPFFNPDASLAVNLGGLGMIVGHELTHGFDDQGAKFAASGALQNWWSEASAARFKAKTQCVVDQYSGYEVLPGMNVNGQLTLGENIADIGGVKLAYQAYRKLAEGKGLPRAGGFTPDQQFFISVGQAWCSKRTDARKKLLLRVDPHSPPRFRINGALADVPAFAEAFQCSEGTPMNRENMCTVW